MFQNHLNHIIITNTCFIHVQEVVMCVLEVVEVGLVMDDVESTEENGELLVPVAKLAITVEEAVLLYNEVVGARGFTR